MSDDRDPDANDTANDWDRALNHVGITHNLPISFDGRLIRRMEELVPPAQPPIASELIGSQRFSLEHTDTGSAIMDYDSESSSDSFQLLINRVIKKSNRLIRVDKTEIPIITSEDMVFADLGSTGMPNGRIAKKRVLMTFDGYTITFDGSGKIYEN